MTDDIKEMAAERRRLRGGLPPVRSHTHIALVRRAIVEVHRLT
jgi:hypothetical protein